MPAGEAAAEEGRDATRGGFARDRVTVLSYAALGAYTFWLYAFGPALALLRIELALSYATVGAYSAVWAGGAALVGMVFPRTTEPAWPTA